ncbi:MAG: 2-C-methyl-D-erythritol 2,4-cyclodiphosphate synthase [Candidatus Magnetoovum sp. WYHC-5]|nr:2-C-methyl-D-erythritol 2,4-cyclodiphosphate synthase [Candidatus Magnetoovum sp. WYHC-5]
MRVGIGYDSHRLVSGRPLIIGGVRLPHEKGLLGHSDGDVLCHSIIDALLGAGGLGNIGNLFPDTDKRWKDADSILLLKSVVEMVKAAGFEITWIDCVIIAEKPKLSPHMDSMKNRLSTAGIQANNINIKAKTNEGMGFIGKEEGIVALTTCLLTKI